MKKLSIFLLACFIGTGLHAQKYVLEYGFKLGGSNVLGDMGGKEKTARAFVWDMKLQETNISLGGFLRYKFNNLVSANLGLTYGRISGDDALSTNPGRRGRNLSFRNDVFDLSLRADIFLYNVNDVGGRGRYRLDFKSFGFLGVSGFHHNPKAQNPGYKGGEWTALRPLRTEGQSKEYNKISMSIPMGVGFFFTYRRQHRFGFELAYHLTFTDYLDDLSGVYPEIDQVADPSLYYVFTNRSPDLPADLLPGGGLGNYAPGEKRASLPGENGGNDTFIFSHLTYSYVLKGKNSFYSQNFNWLGRRGGGRRKVRAKF